MTIKAILKAYPAIEIDLLLGHILKKPKEFLYLNPNKKLAQKQVNDLKSLIKRRQKGEPIAYILGYKYFCGLKFKVTPNVLIPRPETELLVEAALQLVKSEKSKVKIILDLGTGSGCIIISLAKQLPVTNHQLFASDIFKKTLNVAKQNAKANKVEVKFIHSDLLNKVHINADLIIANLPYGWSEWKNNSSAATIGLKFEPKKALFTKEKGLKEIRRLLERIAGSKTKFILLEFDPRQKPDLQNLIKKILPHAEFTFHKDLNKLWRYVEIKIN